MIATIQAIRRKILGYKRPNSVAAEKLLYILDSQGVDVSEALDLISDYQSIERSDYDDAEDYAEERESAWDEVLDAIEEMA